MSEQIKRGPLIQKSQKSNSLTRPKPVLVSGSDDFKFAKEEPKANVNTSMPIKENEKKTHLVDSDRKSAVPHKKVSVVGKHNNVKSIKVPHDLHIQIGVLGKFMDENKTYAIISQLVDYYVKNNLKDRQQRQFEFMTEFLHETDDK